MKNFAIALPLFLSTVGMAAPVLPPHGPFHNPADGYTVVIIGEAPTAVDLSDPALPPGLTAEMIQKGLDDAIAEIEAAGNHADLCLIQPDATAPVTVRGCLTKVRYDAVIVGAGIRVPAPMFPVFEDVMNAVHRFAPQAALGFNTNPIDSAAAAARVLAKYK